MIAQESKNLLPQIIFETLRNSLLSHPLRDRASAKAHKHGATSGFSLIFNTAGVKVVQESPLFTRLYPFFDKVRHPMANAWVLSLLHTAPHEDVSGGGKVSGPLHVDVALQEVLPDNITVSSHQTDIIYVSVPRDIKGKHCHTSGCR